MPDYTNSAKNPFRDVYPLYDERFFAGVKTSLRHSDGLCVEAALEPLLRFASKYLGGAKISVVLKDGEGRGYVAAAVGIDSEFIGSYVPEGQVSDRIMKAGYPAITHIDSRQEGRKTRYGNSFHIGIPFSGNDGQEVAGVLNATDVKDTLRKHKKELIYIAEAVSTVVNSVRSNEEMLSYGLKMLELRDGYSAGHCRRVGELAGTLAKKLGLPREDVAMIEAYGSVHDIGKAGIPDAILNKRGPLNEEETEAMKSHVALGIGCIDPGSKGGKIVAQHHERWDGSGYPRGLGGDEIDRGAGIVAVADVIDAMTSERPYRDAMPLGMVVEEVRRGRGTRHDPHAADAMVRLFGEDPLSIKRALGREDN